MCTALDSTYVWVDTNDDGGAYYRNLLCRLDDTEPIPEFVMNTPYGQGTSLFSLGKQPSFMRSLRSDGTNVQLLSQQMSCALPAGCPKQCRIQLCVHADEDVPVIERDVADSHLTLIVTGHDPDCARETRDMLSRPGDDAESRLKQLSASRALVSCDEKSRVYRKAIAKRALDSLQYSYDFEIPASVGTPEADLVYDTMNFNSVHLLHESGDNFLFACDMNLRTNACIMDSPARGCSIFLGDAQETQKWILPATCGRTVSVATAEGLESIAGALPDMHVPAETADVREALMSYTSLRPDSDTSTSTQCVTDGGNEYGNIDAYNATYPSISPILFASGAPGCTQLMSLQPLVTSLPVAMRPNGRISSVLDCNSVAELLALTSDTSPTVRVPNTPHWQQQLINADTHGRPFHFMNEQTARCGEDNRVMSYEIPRSDLA